jgi:hypothetical protein
MKCKMVESPRREKLNGIVTRILCDFFEEKIFAKFCCVNIMKQSVVIEESAHEFGPKFKYCRVPSKYLLFVVIAGVRGG